MSETCRKCRKLLKITDKTDNPMSENEFFQISGNQWFKGVNDETDTSDTLFSKYVQISIRK